MDEMWRPVVGLEAFYEVSSHGHVRRVARLDPIGRRLDARSIVNGRMSPVKAPDVLAERLRSAAAERHMARGALSRTCPGSRRYATSIGRNSARAAAAEAAYDVALVMAAVWRDAPEAAS